MVEEEELLKSDFDVSCHMRLSAVALLYDSMKCGKICSSVNDVSASTQKPLWENEIERDSK